MILDTPSRDGNHQPQDEGEGETTLRLFQTHPFRNLYEQAIMAFFSWGLARGIAEGVCVASGCVVSFLDRHVFFCPVSPVDIGRINCFQYTPEILTWIFRMMVLQDIKLVAPSSLFWYMTLKFMGLHPKKHVRHPGSIKKTTADKDVLNVQCYKYMFHFFANPFAC